MVILSRKLGDEIFRVIWGSTGHFHRLIRGTETTLARLFPDRSGSIELHREFHGPFVLVEALVYQDRRLFIRTGFLNGIGSVVLAREASRRQQFEAVLRLGSLVAKIREGVL